LRCPPSPSFVSIDLIIVNRPDETTNQTFRHLLEKHELGEKTVETVKAHLSSLGMTIG
jgi:IS5 family transposase